MSQLKVLILLTLGIGGIILTGLCLIWMTEKEFTIVDLEQEQIVQEDGEYYILIEEHQLTLNEGSLQHIELDVYPTYKISYSYNKLFPAKGKITRIEAYGKNLY